MSKYLVACVYVLTGVSKEKQVPFSMHRCSVLDSFNQIESKNFQSRGVGLSLVELAIDEQFYSQFEREFDRQYKGYPVEMDLTMRLDRDGKNVVKGFASVGASVATIVPPGTVAASIVPPGQDKRTA